MAAYPWMAEGEARERVLDALRVDEIALLDSIEGRAVVFRDACERVDSEGGPLAMLVPGHPV